jgi:hypothetical protein
VRQPALRRKARPPHTEQPRRKGRLQHRAPLLRTVPRLHKALLQSKALPRH